MIRIVDKEKCVGCNACVQRCPKSCIAMHEDEQGFPYPRVDMTRCIDCGLCEKVCPVLHQTDAAKPRATNAAKNRDEAVRSESSSGGVFNALASMTIAEGGMVFGARFDETWGGVRHDRAETAAAAKAFQTSKYLQSRTEETFRQAEEALKAGRKVLFSGTPCQIAGLRLFLSGKDYGDRLLLVDTACHGVPSPRVWRDHLAQTCREHGIERIEHVCFRDKRNGWEKYGVCIRGTDAEGRDIEVFRPMTEELFMQVFLKDLCLRPSCYACPAKEGKSRSDITLADFWGIREEYPALYAADFHSLVLTRTPRGEEALRASGVEIVDADYDKALRHNPALEKSCARPGQYAYFWQRYAAEGITSLPAVLERMRPSLVARLKGKIRRMGGRILRKLGLRR